MIKKYLLYLTIGGMLSGFVLNEASLKAQQPTEELTFGEIAAKRQAYYDKLAAEGHDLKGVGYKPFKRWEYYWGKRIGSEAKFSEMKRYLSMRDEPSMSRSELCDGDWSLVGPNTFPQVWNGSNSGGIGRLNRVVPHPEFNGQENQTVFAVNNGGLWRTDDLGDSWVNLTEEVVGLLGKTSLTDVAIDPKDPMTMYIATGVKIRVGHGSMGKNPEQLYPDYASTGVFKTEDGGDSWTSTNFPISGNKLISELHIDPNDTDRVYAVVYSYISWAGNQDTWGSIFRTEDGGESWGDKIYAGPAWDMEFAPHDPSTFYVAGMNNLLKFTNHGGSPAGVPSCANNPDCEDLTPNVMAAGMLPFVGGGASHTEGFKIGVTPANPDKLYILQIRYPETDDLNPFDLFSIKYGQDFAGIFVSDDAGDSFEKVETSNVGFSYMNTASPPVVNPHSTVVAGEYRESISVKMDMSTFLVDPQDEQKIFMAGLSYGFSNDGGESFNVVQSKLVNNHHVDIRDVAVCQNNPNYVFVVEDASFAYSVDAGETFIRPNCNNLSISMLYKIGLFPTATTTSPKIVLGGFLDNTTMIYNGTIWEQPEIVFGDGMEVFVDPNDLSVLFASYQNGLVRRSNDGGKSFSFPIANTSNPLVNEWQNLLSISKENYAWVTPMEIDDNHTFYLGAGEVFKLPNSGANNDFQQVSNFGVIGQHKVETIDGKTYAKTPLNLLRIAPSDRNVIYAGYWLGRKIPGAAGWSSPHYESNRQLFRTTDGGQTWTDILDQKPANKGNGGLLMDIAIDPRNPDRIWIVFSGYFADKLPGGVWGKRRVMMSENGGNTWNAYSEGLPNIPVNSIRYDPNTAADELYIGTEEGVFYRNRFMEEWVCFNAGLPGTPVEEIEINPNTKEIYAGTWGRGIWKSSLRCAEDYDLTLSGSESGYLYEEALNTITSTQILGPTTHVGYRAGTAIHLKTGFHAKANADFLAYLYTCIPFSNPRLGPEEFQGEDDAPDQSVESKRFALNEGEWIKAIPNPFSEHTKLRFHWNPERSGTLHLLDLNGKLVKDLSPHVEMIDKGIGEVVLSRENLAPGLYVCVLKQGDKHHHLKLMIEGR